MFWQKYYFSFTYTLIPVNLLVLQLILFEEQIIPLFIFNVSFFSGSIASHFIFNLITASINSEASKSHKLLAEFYLKFNSLHNTRRKIKVNFKYNIKSFQQIKLKEFQEFFVKTFLFIRFWMQWKEFAIRDL
jgi:hypothetical protein